MIEFVFYVLAEWKQSQHNAATKMNAFLATYAFPGVMCFSSRATTHVITQNGMQNTPSYDRSLVFTFMGYLCETLRQNLVLHCINKTASSQK